MAGGAREVKISDIRIDVVRRELPAHSLQDGIRSTRPVEQGVLRVFTDEGVEGNCLLGAWGAWIPAKSHFRPILDVIKPELVGREPFEREWLWNRMQFLASRIRLGEASWAPMDVALWDIAGKAADLPVYKLFGAQRVAHWLVDRVGVVRNTLDGATAGLTLSGPARLIDGDTLEMRGTRVQLHGIDAPESAQSRRSGGRVWSCGRDAARALVRRASARGPSACEERDRDGYGRIVGLLAEWSRWRNLQLPRDIGGRNDHRLPGRGAIVIPRHRA